MPGSEMVLQHLISQLVDEVIKEFINESATLVSKEGVNHNHGQHQQVDSLVPPLCLNLFPFSVYDIADDCGCLSCHKFHGAFWHNWAWKWKGMPCLVEHWWQHIPPNEANI